VCIAFKNEKNKSESKLRKRNKYFIGLYSLSDRILVDSGMLALASNNQAVGL
jgi:hypothetical protein